MNDIEIFSRLDILSIIAATTLDFPTRAEHFASKMKTTKPGQLKYLETVRSILLNRLAEYKTEIFLFGSIARGDFRSTSDIDIAVLPQKELPPGLLSELREELDDSLIPYRVELVDLSKAPLRFSRRVRKTGIPWNA